MFTYEGRLLVENQKIKERNSCSEGGLYTAIVGNTTYIYEGLLFSRAAHYSTLQSKTNAKHHT